MSEGYFTRTALDSEKEEPAGPLIPVGQKWR